MTRTAILVGNPNVGKSALFGALTGRYVTVSNYPGTTVEVTRGSGTIGKRTWQVLDTPGANGLLPVSEDEQVTRAQLVQSYQPDVYGLAIILVVLFAPGGVGALFKGRLEARRPS